MASSAGPSSAGPASIQVFVAPPGWHEIDFISDLHLGADTPQTFDAWAAHLRHTSADAVFMLGDLFEAWVGDDQRSDSFEAGCVEVMQEAATHCTLAFMHGNRDFLLGPDMLEACGVSSLRDPTRVEAFGQRLVLTHGDALCIADADYQRFRSMVRNPAWQRDFLARPLAERVAIGRATRHASERRKDDPRTDSWIDLDAMAMQLLMTEAGVSTLIHGHTHRPGTNSIAPGFTRHVLTDWDLDQAAAPRAEVLRWNAHGLTRIRPAAGPAAQAS